MAEETVSGCFDCVLPLPQSGIGRHSAQHDMRLSALAVVAMG
jgi:hypothetical protein